MTNSFDDYYGKPIPNRWSNHKEDHRATWQAARAEPVALVREMLDALHASNYLGTHDKAIARANEFLEAERG